MTKSVVSEGAVSAATEQAAARDELLADVAARVDVSIGDVSDVRERIGLFAGGRDIETILDLLDGTAMRLGWVRDAIEAAK